MKKNSNQRPAQDNKKGLRRGGGLIDENQASNLIARADLMVMVAEIIKQRGWTQADAAAFFGVGQPRISDLMQGRVDRFTVDMLMIWLQKLGKDVSVSVQASVFGHAEHGEKTKLTLYVCGAAEPKLIDNIANLFGGDTSRYSLTIVNVLEEPSRAERERIVAIPSLVKESPQPRLVIAGDLSTKSVRWQLATRERNALDNRHSAQELRQATQDDRQEGLDNRETRLNERDARAVDGQDRLSEDKKRRRKS